ncbi:cytochrome P450 3A31 [Truncatella angustata]|uniref:Cytochrome P450 3A31 n=1 Tax=Truncatella angustata TaxID=152316 RepID=A0A9P8ZVW3_9PEZI|nr:cytochrome P450 3A31 [Truncatella angustata]KAH6651497.1 cytochrome P450 3A31 [Truncatella angustata]
MASSTLGQPMILGVIALAASYLLARAIYLAFFHPLARYPGPLLAKFTNAYAAYHGWKGDIHLDMWRAHQRYGDYVRYGPNQLMFNTAEGLRDIYSISASSKFMKAQAYAPMVHRAPNTLTIRGGKDHARRRRIMAQGVSERAQRGYEHRIATHIDKLCSIAFQTDDTVGSRSWSVPMDMSKWCNYLSFDIMADVVFGAKYDLLSNERFRYVVESIDKSNVRMSALIQFPKLAALKIDKYVFRDAIVARNRFVKFVLRVVKDRLEKSKTTSIDIYSSTSSDADVFANLAAAKDPETGEGFRPDEIAAESTTLIVAGSDTSSTAFCSVLFYLADNKDAYAKASEEVRTKFSCREEVCLGATLASCSYVRACIDEALRMSPPVGSALWREAMPGGATVDSHAIPSGIDVGVPIYSVHHDSKYYLKPFEYKPERWLVDDGTGSIERARSVYNPFSVGARGCLGKGLANTEMMLTIATILFVGDFKFADGEEGAIGRGQSGAVHGRHRSNEFQLYDHVTCQKQGPFLQFSPREIC